MPSLYNTYRPLDFSQIVGQVAVCKTIEQQILSNKLHHSIILYGPSGVGKTTLARIIANKLTAPRDVIEKDSALDGKLDNIRALQSDFIHAPWEGEYKIYIFDEAHRVSKAGFDCLLKSIEEPPSHIKFIFVTTNFNSIPLTIRSRSQCFPLSLINNSLLYSLIEGIAQKEGLSLSEDLIKLVVSSASGSPRQAIVILESVICKLEAGSSLEEIFETFGSVGITNLTNFLAYHIFSDFNNLYKSSTMFSDQHVDLEKAITDLQQFIVDTRMGLIYKQNIPNLQTDVSALVKLIIDQQESSGVDKASYRQLVNNRLDFIRHLSTELSKNIPYVRNTSALITGFVIDLARSWKS